ncbi:hypothetical protein [Actinoplanes sp. CA-252034]|uniref:hypothetical protein n=1 Tax=Actinoplanes sp. CA-252034 TaxID=3239906 RepID=UPI003D951941
MTDLGARREAVPPLTASLRMTGGKIDQAWPSAELTTVIDDLADHDQVVLYFQLWRVEAKGAYWTGHESLDVELDLSRPWRQVVEDAREAALIEATAVTPLPNLIATIEWMDRADR